MSTFTTAQQLVLDGARRRVSEAMEAAMEAGREHGWSDPHVSDLMAVATKAEATLQALRGSIVGTGYWATDGGAIDGRWHEGPQQDGGVSDVHWVRYELGVAQAHGYADPISRRITQMG